MTDLLLIAVWALVSAICFALKNIYVKIYTNQRRIEDLHKRLETPNIPSVWTETPTEYTEPKVTTGNVIGLTVGDGVVPLTVGTIDQKEEG